MRDAHDHIFDETPSSSDRRLQRWVLEGRACLCIQHAWTQLDAYRKKVPKLYSIAKESCDAEIVTHDSISHHFGYRHRGTITKWFRERPNDPVRLLGVLAVINVDWRAFEPRPSNRDLKFAGLRWAMSRFHGFEPTSVDDDLKPSEEVLLILIRAFDDYEWPMVRGLTRMRPLDGPRIAKRLSISWPRLDEVDAEWGSAYAKCLDSIELEESGVRHANALS